MTLRIEKVVVTGGREFNDLARIEADLRALIPVGLRRLAHGGARGADNRAETAWRRAKPWPRETEVYSVSSAEWKRYGDAAGPMRNAKMLEAEKPDVVLAYPNPPTATTASRGTWDCVMQAISRDIPVVIWATWEQLAAVKLATLVRREDADKQEHFACIPDLCRVPDYLELFDA